MGKGKDKGKGKDNGVCWNCGEIDNCSQDCPSKKRLSEGFVIMEANAVQDQARAWAGDGTLAKADRTGEAQGKSRQNQCEW